MKIFITGGLGFVGGHLTRAFLEDGHRVTATGRSRSPSNMIDHHAFTYLVADTTKPGEWQEKVKDHEVIVNLAGKSIFTFWTEKAKKEIYDSRILTTRNLSDAITAEQNKLLISTSAVGIYGDRGDDLLTEDEPPGDDFLATVSKDWEREALLVNSSANRVVLARFGIVLARDGGAMATMIPAFKLFAGGKLGSGEQWFPWIHIDDLVAAYRFVIDHSGISGPVNWCGPEQVKNKTMTELLAARLHRPALFPVPAFVMKTVLGEFGQALICSQRATPKVLVDSGFSFHHEHIGSAFDEIVGK